MFFTGLDRAMIRSQVLSRLDSRHKKLHCVFEEVEMNREDNPVLVPFGSTRCIPPNHQWCFACDGSGVDSLDDEEKKPCEVCNGKGHWNEEDITEYHRKYPEICQESCGEKHRKVFF